MILSDKTLSRLIREEKIKIENTNYNIEKSYPAGSKSRKELLGRCDKLGFSQKETEALKFNPRQIESGSIDLRLGNTFSFPDKKSLETGAFITFDKEVKYITKKTDKFILPPNDFILAATQEHIYLDNNICALVEGRTSVGRLGLFTENARWVDPGFNGEITLHLFNSSRRPMVLTPGQRVSQLIFSYTDDNPIFPYRGKYQGQKGPTGSKIYKDYEKID